MSTRTWNLRMNATYEGDKNKVATAVTEQLSDGEWKPLQINNDSPGFLIFVYSLLSCQHLYMHINAAEQGLVLSASSGTMTLVASQDWKLASLHINFAAKLISGTPTTAIIDDIQGRMNQCPVSRNIVVAGVHESLLTFN
jgi:hypothetical protein